ncbi:hypothetical protein [Bacillus siamensis]|uniref:hypothetical protein n=1 Tax=Bacillus siamensis TaxID=659243 RepID=UPI000690DEEE|nr:hypothetical protein [Bacillus siamensis]MED0772384.1 hypothetical protein [Bacillus siamensis]MED0776481.1 hypothetical protein [Bacillus siamensis]MED0778138.1 hypothetical protein [Bacillus siamensis]MED0834995.1 hypothetical protein [Bacillus siamensis]
MKLRIIKESASLHFDHAAYFMPCSRLKSSHYYQNQCMSSIYLGICRKKVGEEGLKISLAMFSDYAEADLALAGGILMPIHFKLAYFKCLPTNGKKKLSL